MIRLGISFLFLATIFSCGCKKQAPVTEPSPPKLKVNGAVFVESNVDQNANVIIKLDSASSTAIQVDYRFVDGSARFGEDFTSTTSSITIPAGALEAEIAFVILGDSLKEPDETFNVVLNKAVDASIVGSSATVTIQNDDTIVVVPTNGYSTPTSYSGYKLVWQDEFSGSTISNDWTFETGNSGWGNNELQYYTNGNNAEIVNGNLIIEARKESYQGADYTSTRMITRDKQDFTYGRIDIRAVLPEGQGIWPALWMLGSNYTSVGWPGCGEIDIMELVGHEPSTVHGTVHWENGGHVQFGDSYSLSSSKKFIDEYHVFSIIWDANSIKWFVNDIQYSEVSITPGHMTEFHAPAFFIFNIAVGGNWPGYPDATTQFPQYMIVDYVRVFEKI